MLGEALEHHLIVPAPRGEAEGAGAHGVAGEGGAALVGLFPRHHRGCVVRQQMQERRERPIEPDLHDEVVDDVDARDLDGAARDHVTGADDLLEDPGPLAPGGPLEGVLHVGGAHRPAVVEAHARAQPERVDPLVGGHRPARGERSHGAQPVVQLQQGVEDLANHGGRGHVCRLGRIQRRRIGDEDRAQRAAGFSRLLGDAGADRGQDDERQHAPGETAAEPAHSAASSHMVLRRWRPVGCRRSPRTSGRATPQSRRT